MFMELVEACQAEQDKRGLVLGEDFTEDQMQAIADIAVKEVFRPKTEGDEAVDMSVEEVVKDAFDAVLNPMVGE